MKNITVIGIGRLGLGFALLLEKSGFNVMGIDVNPNYLNQLENKTFDSAEPGYNELLQNCKNFQTSTSLETGLEFSNLIFILVPTPNGGGNRFYDHSILSSLLTNINKLAPKNKHLVIGCTVMPKYCDEVALHLLENCENCSLSYNPEFIAQGDIVRGFENPDIILVGTNSREEIPAIMKNIYSKMAINNPKYCFLTLREAEITKIAINGYITTKISYANMISDFCDILGANTTQVLDAIGSDSRIGTKYFKAGYSFGGPCFPRDTKALSQCVEEANLPTDLLKATTQYNDFHIDFQAEQLLEYAQLQGANKITIERVCYKEDSKIPIIEESAKLKIAHKLSKYINIEIKDTKELIQEVKKEYGNLFQYTVCE